jgi:hypothetical protein
VAAVVAACSDGSQTTTAPPPPAPTVFLKDIVIPNLPSPYYHFEYDATGRVSSASFASSLTMYGVTYDGGRISQMKNNTLGNQDRLEYVYDNQGRVSSVTYVDPNGVVFTRVSLSYAGQKLTGIERARKLGADFVVDKTMTFSYYPDGNLLEITDHRPAVEGRQTESETFDRFEQYDDKVNVDAFSLIHNDFFDHLVLLPGVQLQKGNPGRETLTGSGDNFVIDYTYSYDDKNRPLTKSGDALALNGVNAGRRFQTTSQFSYY